MLAAVSCVQSAYPNNVVRGFAVIRTMSKKEVTEIVEVVEGVISTSYSGHVSRNPLSGSYRTNAAVSIQTNALCTLLRTHSCIG